MEKITNPFHEAAYKERLAFKEFTNKHLLFKEPKFSTYCTDYMACDPYDAFVMDMVNNKRLYIEIKIRSDEATEIANTEGFFYEYKKHNQLLKKMKDMYLTDKECGIAYISFTSEGTYVWRTDIINLGKPVKRLMNKATMKSTAEKEMKRVYLLKKEDAKFYEFKWIDVRYWDEKPKAIETRKLSSSCKKSTASMSFFGMDI